MKYFDIHTHLNFVTYENDREDVIERALKGGVSLINIGTQYQTSLKAVEISNTHESCYSIIGLHPVHTDKSYHDEEEIGEGGDEFTSRGEIFDSEKYQEIFNTNKKIVGVGECGLDYYRTEKSSLEKQRIAFHSQIQFALKNDLPLMLHIRPTQDSLDAYRDCLSILDEYSSYGEKLRGDVHFFAGDISIAEEFLSRGFTLSYTGVITFARKHYEEVISYTPMDMIFAETDAPFVSPIPHRGERNEPVHVIEVYKTIADIKGISLEECASTIADNVHRVWKI
ncbi:MAG: TatD DNase family protein [Flavobacteriaceae bacterium]|jgi:TatD DNase family protein